MISGIVISSSAECGLFGKFILNRFLRLYPGAWLSAAISIFVLYFFDFELSEIGISSELSLNRIIGSVFLISTRGEYLSSAYWTICIELSFYAFIAIFICTDFDEKIILAAKILSIVGIPYYALLYIDYCHIISMPWVDLGYGIKNMILMRHGPYFAIGMYLHFYHSKKRSLLNINDFILFFVSLLMSVLGIIWRSQNVLPYYAVSENLNIVQISAVVSFFAAFLMLYVSLQFNDAFQHSDKTRAKIRKIGLITYPLYLLHESLGGTLLFYFIGLGISPLIGVILALIGVTAVALIVVEVEIFIRPLIREAIGKLV